MATLFSGWPSAAGLAETSNEFGGALGIAVLGSAIAAVYHLELSGQVPVDVSDQQRAALLGTVAGAIDAAGRLPIPLATRSPKRRPMRSPTESKWPG